MIFDTHAHCYWEGLGSRIGEVVENMHAHGVTKAVQIGCDIESSRQALSLAKAFPGVFYATIGHHPETAQHFSDIAISEFDTLVRENREYIVAIGETGFDYHYLTPGEEPEQKKNQESWWLAQWELAKKYHLPLVIHTRDARDDTLEFMKKHNINRAVIHCYSEDPQFAQSLMEFSSDIYFAFGGILTYRKSEAVQATVGMLPLNRILLETDSPFLAPQVVRGTVNEPANTRYVLDRLSEIRTESREEIESVIYANSLRFYSLES